MNSLSSLALELTKMIGSKELSLGCLVHTNGDDFADIMTYVGDWHYITQDGRLRYTSENEMSDGWLEEKWFSVIGYPCQLHDLFRWSEGKYDKDGGKLSISISSIFDEIKIEGKNIPYIHSTPLYSQSDETLQYIINLIKVCNT